MAYRRYCENEKGEIKRNKEMISIGKEIEIMKTENVQLREKLAEQEKSHDEQPKDADLVTTNGGTNGNPDVSTSQHTLRSRIIWQRGKCPGPAFL